MYRFMYGSLKSRSLKRKAALIIAAVMALMCLTPLIAAADSGQYVFDEAGALKDEEVTILNTRCQWFANDGLKLIIASEKGASSDAEAMADQYSAELNGDPGLVFFMDSASEESALIAYNGADIVFGGEICSAVNEYASDEMKDGSYFRACEMVVHNVNNIYSYNIAPQASGFFNAPVTDNAGYLSDDQLSELNERIQGIRDKYDFDLAVCIDQTQWGDTAQAAADDTYDYYMYGAGAGSDGLLLYISADPRNYAVTQHGSGTTAFNDDGLDYLTTLFLPDMKEDKYFEACSAYADGAEELLQMAAAGQPFKYEADRGKIAAEVVFALIIAFVIAFFAAKRSNKSKAEEMNTAREQVDAHGYMRPGSFSLQMSQDVFLYSRMDRRKIEKQSGGSGTHTSSSGRSHGGTSGSY